MDLSQESHGRRTASFRRLSWIRPAAVGLLLLAAPGFSKADDLLGLYVGAGIGQSNVSLDRFPDAAANPVDFSKHATGWKALVGIRPLPWVGGEVEYVDLGHPSRLLDSSSTTSGVPGSAKVSGPALFAVAYLPVPLVDLFGKVGVSHLQSSGEAAAIGIVGVDTCAQVPNTLGCRLFRDDRQRTSPAWGAGVQLTASPFVVRLEYERFGTGSVHPSLAGLTVNWTF